MRDIPFTQDAFKEYNKWAEADPDIFLKIIDFIKEIARDPFKGKGKPEPLKGEFKGYWSRRLTEKHRLIYRVDDNSVRIIKCYGHYS